MPPVATSSALRQRLGNGFLGRYRPPAIIDEVQRVPDLLSPPVIVDAETGARLTATAVKGNVIDITLIPTTVLGETCMTQITARVPDPLVEALDSAARILNRSRAEVVRQAVERYLEDFEDLNVALTRLQDPTDEVLDWDQVKRELLDSD